MATKVNQPGHVTPGQAKMDAAKNGGVENDPKFDQTSNEGIDTQPQTNAEDIKRAEEVGKQTPRVNATQDTEGQQAFATGFNFNLYEISELYGLMRDGNYWSAFKMAVNILHENINVESGRPRGNVTREPLAVGNRVQQPVRLSEVQDLETKLAECCKQLEGDQQRSDSVRGAKSEAVRASQEKNVKAINLMGLIALVNMIREMMKKFREERA